MGKLLSKHASKRRESPEGGSFASNVLTCQRELERTGITHKIQKKQELCRGVLKEDSQHDRHLEVELPPEKGSNRDNNSNHPVSKRTMMRNSRAGQTKCSLVKQDEQQWVFTLYDFDNSGKLTKEDMSSLMHSIHEVLETAWRQRCGSTIALRVKLVLAPSSRPGRVLQTDKEQGLFQGFSSPESRPNCADENPERRNHYLDLAGIENYASKFDNAEFLSQKPRQETCSALQHHPAAASENCNSTESIRGFSILRSLRNKNKVVEVERKSGGGNSARLDGQNPALPCHLAQPKLEAQGPLQRTHSKRHHSRPQDTGLSSRNPGSQVPSGAEREILHNTSASCGALASVAHRHEHHHHHKHLHHHHHHHYYQT